MLGTLQSASLITGYATLASPTTTSTSGIKLEKDKEGNVEAIGFKSTRGTTAILASSATTAISLGNETGADIHFEQLNNVRDAQAYVESMSDDELLQLEAMLEEKANEFPQASEIESTEAKVYSKNK